MDDACAGVFALAVGGIGMPGLDDPAIFFIDCLQDDDALPGRRHWADYIEETFIAAILAQVGQV